MLTGKKIIITGASSGLGRSAAISLSKAGAKCILIGRDMARLQEVKDECVSESHLMSVDLLDFESYDSIVEEAFSTYGPVYGLVHSAGIEQTIPLQLLKVEDMRRIFEINVFSAVELIKRITKKKIKDTEQSMVLIASVMGVVGNKGLTSYSASKGAIISMVKSMALELASKGVRVNAVSPGHISDTLMAANKEKMLSTEANEKIRDSHPLGLGECNDVAEAVKFLLSSQSKWITGQNLIVDGGYTIQ